MITATQIVCHLVGDYIIQSDWMASTKTKRSLPALAHAVTYTLPFLFVTMSWKALAFICLTHFLIDRFRLARYICWVKNFLAPPHSNTSGNVYIFHNGRPFTMDEALGPPIGTIVLSAGKKYKTLKPINLDGTLETMELDKWWHSWKFCSMTGYPDERTRQSPWMTVWLMIITDNTIHIILNALAIGYLS